MGRKSRFKTTPDHIAEAVRSRILRGELQPGASVRQDELAARFNVSRVPVREALRSLVAEGLMHWQPHQGFRVVRLEPAEAREILQIRSLLEVQALKWAFTSITRADVRAAASALTRAENTESLDEWSEMNGVFHSAILQPCNRPHLMALIRHLNNRVDGYIRLLVQRADYRTQAEREHRAVLTAVEAGDLAAATTLLQQHIEDTADRLDDFLARHRPPSLNRGLGRRKQKAAQPAEQSLSPANVTGVSREAASPAVGAAAMTDIGPGSGATLPFVGASQAHGHGALTEDDIRDVLDCVDRLLQKRRT